MQLPRLHPITIDLADVCFFLLVLPVAPEVVAMSYYGGTADIWSGKFAAAKVVDWKPGRLSQQEFVSSMYSWSPLLFAPLQ